MSYFTNPRYDTWELAEFVRTIILTTQDNSPQLMKNTQIPLIQSNIFTTFTLSCIQETVVFPKACNYFLEQFLATFFVYQLHNDFLGLRNIFSALERTTYRERFCDGLKKYLLYSNTIDPQLETLFSACWPSYNDFYKKIGFFVDIEQQLLNGYISSDVYKDPLLNAYKLLSYQQILYQDFQSLKIRKNQYIAYINFVQEAIKRDALPPFYLDEIYWYNTYYLKPTLLTIRYDRRRSNIKEAEIMQVIKAIDTLAIGNSLSQATWLTYMISNTLLVPAASDTTPIETLSLQEQIAKNMASIPYFIVSQSSIADTAVTAQWHFLLQWKKISSTITLVYTNDWFLVKTVTLPDYPDLTTTLQWLLSSQELSLGEFFTSLNKHISFYQWWTTPTTDLTSFCKELREQEDSLDMHIATCTQDVVVVVKLFWDTSISFTFLLENFVPTKISVSDSDFQTALEKTIQQKSFQPSSLLEAITFVLSIQVPSSTVIHRWSFAALITLQDFKNFLGVDAKDIAEKNGKIFVDFSLGGVNFIAHYDNISRKILTLYFKDVLYNAQPLWIKSSELLLTGWSAAVQTFRENPLEYIKTKDFAAWQNYIQKK